MMAEAFTLGIEQEFQLVNRETGQLSSRIGDILPKGIERLGNQIKQESKQASIEVVTGICPTINEAREQVTGLKAALLDLVEPEGLAIIGAGTHPSSHWEDQKTTQADRYQRLEEQYQDIERNMVIYGLHIHIGIPDDEMAITLMNQVRNWLPHLLAISVNSPFWSGRNTGLKSYRSILWKELPRTGVPEIIASRADFDQEIQKLIQMHCISSGRDLCWDVRPHHQLPTLEFRICDMPGTSRETLILAALCQALLYKLAWLNRHGKTVYVPKRSEVEENKWSVIRYGLDGHLADFMAARSVPTREALYEMLEFVEDVIDDLESGLQMQHLRSLLEADISTGADRQIAVYEQSGEIQSVVDFLIKETREK